MDPLQTEHSDNSDQTESAAKIEPTQTASEGLETMIWCNDTDSPPVRTQSFPGMSSLSINSYGTLWSCRETSQLMEEKFKAICFRTIFEQADLRPTRKSIILERLDSGKDLDHSQLNEISRVATDALLTLAGTYYPSPKMGILMARAIVRAFPSLAPESTWFQYSNINGRMLKSGKLHARVENLRRASNIRSRLPASNSNGGGCFTSQAGKKRRSNCLKVMNIKKTEKETPETTTEENEELDTDIVVLENPNNYSWSVIDEAFSKTKLIRDEMRKKQEPIDQILMQFPIFKVFDGIMIRREFELCHPKLDRMQLRWNFKQFQFKAIRLEPDIKENFHEDSFFQLLHVVIKHSQVKKDPDSYNIFTKFIEWAPGGEEKLETIQMLRKSWKNPFMLIEGEEIFSRGPCTIVLPNDLIELGPNVEDAFLTFLEFMAIFKLPFYSNYEPAVGFFMTYVFKTSTTPFVRVHNFHRKLMDS